MAITTDKPDLVLFVGPVIVKEHFKSVPWKRPTEIVMVRNGRTSADFRLLGERSLDQIVKAYTGSSSDAFRKIAISAWSKGGSFTDAVMQREESRDRIDSVILNDAVFGSQHDGLREYLLRAADGEKLLVITNTNNVASSSLSKRARESVEDLVAPVGAELSETSPRGSMPTPSRGVWTVGDLFWYDYVQPNGQNDITHEAHHDLAPVTWDAYLVPRFGEGFPILLAMAGAAALVGAVWYAHER